MSFYKEYCHTYNGYGKDLCHMTTVYITTTRYEVIWSHNDHFNTALGKKWEEV